MLYTFFLAAFPLQHYVADWRWYIRGRCPINDELCGNNQTVGQGSGTMLVLRNQTDQVVRYSYCAEVEPHKLGRDKVGVGFQNPQQRARASLFLHDGEYVSSIDFQSSYGADCTPNQPMCRGP